MVLLAILITVGIGIGGFALLWKTLSPSKAARSDAGASVSDSLAHAPALGAPTAPVAQGVGIPPPDAPDAGTVAETRAGTTPQPAKAKATRSIATLFAAKDYAGTVGACLQHPPASMHRALCATAACAVRDVPHAKRWLDSAPRSERPGIIEQCRRLGVSLALRTKPTTVLRTRTAAFSSPSSDRAGSAVL
jgi:sugar phosphate isomerase/epimerase